MDMISTETIRRHVLGAHARLRDRSALLTRDALESARESGHLRGLIVELFAILGECDVLEERELVPLLSDVDAWGPARVERLRECHARHKNALAVLARELVCGPPVPADVVERFEQIIGALLQDLDEEEVELREAEELEDLPVVSEQTSG